MCRGSIKALNYSNLDYGIIPGNYILHVYAKLDCMSEYKQTRASLAV